MTVAEWEAAAEALRDDGYDEGLVAEVLGPCPDRPEQVTLPEDIAPTEDPPQPNGAIPRENGSGPEPPDVVIPPMPPGYVPSWGERGDTGPVGGVGRQLLGVALAPEPVDDRPQRPAPVLARVQLSRSAKIERVAKAMAILRGEGGWRLLASAKQRSFLTLAEFAVDAIALVEEQEVELKKPERIKPELRG